jgi:predicted transposase YbfD/YdcC
MSRRCRQLAPVPTQSERSLRAGRQLNARWPSSGAYQKDEWAGLQAVATVESSREIGAKISCERRCYLCSMTDVTRIALTICHHWAIENPQHWILHVQFRGRCPPHQKKPFPPHLGLIHRAALNLLQQDTSSKGSIRRRKMRSLSI